MKSTHRRNRTFFFHFYHIRYQKPISSDTRQFRAFHIVRDLVYLPFYSLCYIMMVCIEKVETEKIEEKRLKKKAEKKNVDHTKRWKKNVETKNVEEKRAKERNVERKNVEHIMSKILKMA